jgi:enamine deaminase RidA (YjgF/YER057c/UK114 family)
VKLTAYLTSLDAYPVFGEVRRSVFGEDLPASTAIQVAGLLFGAAVEIDAIAFIPAPE